MKKNKIDYKKYWSPTFETMSGFVYILDKDFNVLKVNKAIIDFTKKNESSLLGKKCYKAIYKTNKSINNDCPYKRMLKSKRFEKVEVYIQKAKKWIYIRANPVLDEKNNVIGGIMFSEDITDRKKTEKLLIESRNQFESFFENQPEYAYMVSKEGIIINMNKSALKILGYKKSEIVGKKLKIIYAKEVHAKSENIFRKWKRTGEIDNEEMIIVSKRGRKRTVMLNVNAIRDNNGKILHSISLQRDITELKKAEERLKDERDRSQRYFDIAKVIMIVIDKDHKVSMINQKGCEILGYPEKDIIGKNWFKNFLPEKIRSKVEKLSRRMLAGKLEVNEYFENPVLTKNGEEKIIAWRGVVLKDNNGKITGHLSSGEDITEHKKAELALKESEEKFRTLAEQSPNMIFINKKGRIVYVNKKCEEVMGYKKEEFYTPDFDFRKLIAPEYKNLVEESFKKHMLGKSVNPYEFAVVTKKGGRLEAILANKLINYEGEKAIIGILTDISDRKKLENIKDNLICDVSHSLKTPIAITAMALEVSKGAIQVNDIAQLKRFQAIAYVNIKKARKDIDDVLEIFNLEAGKIDSEINKKGKASLTSVLKETLRGINYLIKEKGLNISVDIAENAKKVEINKKDAIILISNILDNAVKFTGKGGISIKSRLKGNEVEIVIKDTGSGIEPKDIEKIFDKFHRGHSAAEGSGLGLSICKGIVDTYGGKIKAMSKGKGLGTAMIIRLSKG